MRRIEPITIQQREGGNFLVGDWPQVVAMTPDVVPFMVRPGTPQLRIGDDFLIEFVNGRAVYRYVENDLSGNLVCELCNSQRWHNGSL